MEHGYCQGRCGSQDENAKVGSLVLEYKTHELTKKGSGDVPESRLCHGCPRTCRARRERSINGRRAKDETCRPESASQIPQRQAQRTCQEVNFVLFMFDNMHVMICASMSITVLSMKIVKQTKSE